MMEMFRRAHEHQGAAFVEVYQNCNVFNDGAFEGITEQGRAGRHADRPRSTASRSASAPRASSASCSTSSARPRSSTSPTSARTRLLVHDEHRRRPDARVRALAAGRPADHADAGRCVPRRRAPGVRAPRCSGSSSAASERSGPGDLAALLATGATWDDRLTGSRTVTTGLTAGRRQRLARRSVVEGAEDHARARLGREERRLLRHAHAGERGRAGLRDRDRVAAGRAASARPWRRARRRRASRGGTSTLAPRAAGDHDRFERAVSIVARPRGGSSAARGPRARVADAAARGRRRRRARARPRARIAISSSRRRASGVFGPTVSIVNASASAARRSGPGGEVHEPVDRLDAELVVGQLDDERHDRAGAGIACPGAAAARRGRRARSRSGGARRRGRAGTRPTAARDRGDACAGSSIAKSAWLPRPRRCRSPRRPARVDEQSVRPSVERQAPDRVEVQRASPAAARAGRSWPSAACARAAARSPSPGLGQRRARRGRRRWCGARRVLVGEVHAVAVEARAAGRGRARRRRATSRSAARRARSDRRRRRRRGGGSGAPRCRGARPRAWRAGPRRSRRKVARRRAAGPAVAAVAAA